MITKLVRLFPIHLVKIKTHLKGPRQGHPLKGSVFVHSQAVQSLNSDPIFQSLDKIQQELRRSVYDDIT